MKYLTLAVACGLMLTACGGSEDSPVPPPPGLTGLWQATSVYDANDTAITAPLASGEMYMLLENATANPIDISFYSKADNANCLEVEKDKVTHIGNNRYSDGSEEVAVMIANGNSLTLILSDNELTLGVRLQKNSGLSKADLPVCGVQRDATTLIQDDAASNGFLQSILSKLSRKSS